MTAEELFKSGRLAEAVQEQLSTVKRNASDLNARFFLAELLCFQGEWERADRQLDVIVQHPENHTLRAQLLRQLIRGEVIREQVIGEGRPPELVVALPPAVQEQLKLCGALRLKQLTDCPALLEAMNNLQVPVAGKCNDENFESIEDLDDRFRGTLEVITANGKYFWVPWQAVTMVQLSPPERPMDLLWRRASIDVAGGPKGESYVPVRYPCPQAGAWTDAHRLSRATDWEGDDASAVTGIGQRMLALDDRYVAMMEMKSLSAHPPAPAQTANGSDTVGNSEHAPDGSQEDSDGTVDWLPPA
ncbi:MAG: SciE type virulence protein [Pirellulaceae bacterium]|nr:SciE type virulence protein [Pirellulaceae bacterium]